MRLVKWALLAFVSMVAAGRGLDRAAAQTAAYPTKPVRLIITFAAGGVGDVFGRIVAERAGAELGQAVYVENRAGGNSVIGTQAAARAEPDGYTVLLLTTANLIITLLQENLPYDLERDFTPVMGLGSFPLVLSVPGRSAIHSIADLATVAKSMPGGLNYASGGRGSLGHLSAALLLQALEVKGTHLAYRGNAPAIQDLVTNRVQLLFSSTVESLELVGSGDLRLLGTTAANRIAKIPGVPTMKELGLGQIDPSIWYGLQVPSGTPPANVQRLYEAFSKAMADAGVRQRIDAFNFTANVTDGAELANLIRSEAKRWKKVIVENNIRADN